MPNKELENLTDTELRFKLLQSGFPNLPITETTRKIIIKKLKNHFKKDNNQIKSKTDFNLDQEHKQKVAFVDRVGPYKLQSNFHDNNCKLFHENSDLHSVSLTKPTKSSVNGLATRQLLSSKPAEVTDYYSNSVGSNIWRSNSLNDAISPVNICSNGDKLSQNPHYGLVNRLLSLRNTTLQKQQSSSHLTLSADELSVPNPKMYKARNQYRPLGAPKAMLTQFISRLKAYAEFKQMIIPQALVCAFVIFFVGLSFIYMIKSSDFSITFLENSTHFTKCSDIDAAIVHKQSLHSTNCIDDDILSATITLYKELIRLLQERVEKHYCSDINLSMTVSAEELINYHNKNSYMNDNNILRKLQAVEYLIKRNVNSKLSIVNIDGSSVTLFGLSKSISSQDIHFINMKPRLPLKCILYNKIQRFFLIIGTGTLVGFVVLISYYAYQYVKRWNNERIVAADNFTTDIVNELMYKASQSNNSEEQEVVINHLRDKLIPIQKRDSLLWSWNTALRMLESNESRIQFGTTLRNGEEFSTMKWVDNSFPIKAKYQRCEKQWQSPAFGNANKISNPPTPCLKIRHMFDASEIKHPKLKQIIEEAILEKVGLRCNIYDIQLDRQSCCVYVRCASIEDAGIVHNEINGWWFDNRLLSIKFLRLQRYLSRFPKSSELNSLLPSSPNNLCSPQNEQ